MIDIFDTKILCKKCNAEMQQTIVNKAGAELRAVKCQRCGEKIIHPADLNCLEHFKNLKGKNYVVKLRIVGNSHTISIPKEIINFINEMQGNAKKHMEDMVRLCFEDFRKLSLHFGDVFDTKKHDVEEDWR